MTRSTKSGKSRLVTNTLANGAAQFGAILASFVLLPWLIDAFGKSGYGLYVLAASVSGYAALLDFGVGASFVKLVAEHSARGEKDEVGKAFSTALLFYTAVGIVAGLTIAVLARNAQAIFDVTPAEARLLEDLLRVAAVGALFTWPLNTGGYFLQGLERYTTTARTAATVATVNIGLTVLVIVSGQGPLALLAAQTATAIAGGVANLLIARRHLEGVRISPLLANRSVMRRIISYSWAIFVVQICTVVIYQQTDRLILGIALGATAVALYEGAGKFQTLVVQVTGFANSAVVPTASSLESQGRTDSLRTMFLRGTKYCLALVLPLVVVLLVFAKPLLTSWLGPEFGAVALTAQVFLVHQLLTPATAVGDNILVGLGRYDKRVPWVVGLLAMGNLAIAIPLVGRIGILAVALGTTIPHLIDIIPHMRLILAEVGVGFAEYWRGVILPIYPALIVPLTITLLATTTSLTDSLLGITTAGAIAVVGYWLTLATFGLNDTERAEVKALAAKLRLFTR